MRALLLSLFCLVSQPLWAGENELSAAVVTLQAPETVLIDVRSAEEFAAGALPGAEHIDYQEIGSQIAALVPDKDTPIVLYCRSGRRSGIAEQSLRELGYRNLINAGGYEELKAALESQD
ncbi:rhodanese-like domain-containing protein [Pseudomonas sp. 5P_3.1_Bac2]|uniref:rhodanese-like domain-containing protein n=1 Tax=Pseudomonas sp. 5P_3.1_Bac2 TaxID=2971617 RepID=UPI0021C9DBED|nr:rhodanese-like domain-containing protein [Pseudomonas sp. 5P_3.1_Bac2]MCU1716223.1 rhodanese-like domain-containing protein [Pseudomonas sp. 5P_3.1_Bac2]